MLAHISGDCARCVLEMEGSLQAIRDYHGAANVWLWLIPADAAHSFFSQSLVNWVEANLSEEYGRKEKEKWPER